MRMCTLRVCTSPGHEAEIIFGTGPDSMDTNKTLHNISLVFSFFAKRKLLIAIFILCSWHRQLTTWKCCDTTCALQIKKVMIRPHMNIMWWHGNFLKELVCSPTTNKNDKQREITGFVFIIKQKKKYIYIYIYHSLTNKYKDTQNKNFIHNNFKHQLPITSMASSLYSSLFNISLNLKYTDNSKNNLETFTVMLTLWHWTL